MKVIIVGGVAGGATAAARLRRLDETAEIVVFERSGYVSYANCGLPYYIGGVITDKEELTLQTPESFWRRFRVDMRVRHEVTAIHPAEKTVDVRNLATGETFTESYDKLVLSPGARPTQPALPGVGIDRLFTLRTVEDTLKIQEFIEQHHPRSAVLAGGGFIGVGEPSGHPYQGHILQLASVLGVEEENGFTLNYDKYNWEEHPNHFILQDADQPIDFGEGKKNIYALEGTEVLMQRNKEVQMAAHDFGKGRAVYISGVPYSFANSRTLYRAILWSAHSEEELHTWFSSNYNVEVHAYVKNGKYCVVNNTYEPQDTTVYTTDGSSFALHLDANEIKWYEI